jgi:hypothetical protein
MRAIRIIMVSLLCMLSGAAAHGQDYGYQWATITHAGNRPVNQTEAPFLFPPWVQTLRPYGQVNHEYRITTTEVTNAQWYEFVRAYAPYWTGPSADISLSSRFISATTSRPRSADDWVLVPGTENWPAQGMSWIYAARFTNWLHNNKQSDLASFERGVYDVPSPAFDGIPPLDGFLPSVPTRSASARFWLPSQDEWIKAAHYDPNRYGPGQDGYWRYTDGTNNVPVQGWPENGGTTDANMPSEPGGIYRILDVGSYTNVRTPWGLLDANSGASEYTDTLFPDGQTSAGQRYGVVSMGLARFGVGPGGREGRIDGTVNGAVSSFFSGIRIASVVPAPNTLAVSIMLAVLSRRRR